MRSKPMRALLIVVVTFSVTGCAASVSPRPFPRPGAARVDPPAAPLPEDNAATSPMPAPPTGGYEISGTALGLRGAPYRNGGADPGGFDCSGLVFYVFAQHGVAVPRTVAELYRAGGTVDASELRPGDLVFFSTTATGATHVGIAVGGDSFVHAPTSTGVVRVEQIGSSYWGPRFIGARRVV